MPASLGEMIPFVAIRLSVREVFPWSCVAYLNIHVSDDERVVTNVQRVQEYISVRTVSLMSLWRGFSGRGRAFLISSAFR